MRYFLHANVIVVLAFIAFFQVYQGQCSDNSGVSAALKIYEECSQTEGFSPCLKKKAVALLDRLGRMQKLNIAEGFTIVHKVDENLGPSTTEDQLDASLPRALEAKDEALTNMIIDKTSKFLGSSTIEISPRLIENEIETARDGFGEGGGGGGGKKGGGGGGGGGKGGGGKKGGGMMEGLMMVIAGKIAGLIPLAIGGLFLLAGKALITAKIALLLSGIIALKKLFGSHHGGHEHVEHVHASAHGGGGGHHGGWDKRSIEDPQNLAYKAQKPL